jgi:hypothetical protein
MDLTQLGPIPPTFQKGILRGVLSVFRISQKKH